MYDDLGFRARARAQERQRLNLARLLLQPNVDLAILDESTSALDEENERTAYELATGVVLEDKAVFRIWSQNSTLSIVVT